MRTLYFYSVFITVPFFLIGCGFVFQKANGVGITVADMKNENAYKSGYESYGSGYESDGSGYESDGSGYESDGSGYESDGSGYESGYESAAPSTIQWNEKTDSILKIIYGAISNDDGKSNFSNEHVDVVKDLASDVSKAYRKLLLEYDEERANYDKKFWRALAEIFNTAK